MKIASAQVKDARVSMKHSLILCEEIKGKRLETAKKLFEDLIEGERSLDGKYYTRTAKIILPILKSAEANAKQKNYNLEKLFVKTAHVNQSAKFRRPRSKHRLRGQILKSAHVLIELEER
ncbi:MAG: uL22 family ribosomal protein [Candidatus Aenigmatarchaeota archaeon]